MRILLAAALASILTLAGAAGLGYQPPNLQADAPQAPAESASTLWKAAASGCMEWGGTWSAGLEDGVLVGRCHPLPNVGIQPAVAWRRR